MNDNMTPEPASTALALDGLTKRFPGFCLDGLTLSLPRGCTLGLIGENGAGKSTAIKAILGIVNADAGRVTLLGRDAKDSIELTKQDIGVVLDNIGLPVCLNAKKVGRVMHDVYTNWNDDIYASYLEKFGLPPKKKLSAYSRGMRMKLSIAISLSHDAKLLILDEATSGLDPVVRDEVTDIFFDFTRDGGRSILISSHIVSDLEKLCDYIAFLHGGKLLLCDEKDRLLERFGTLHCDGKALASLPDGAVISERRTDYGVTALVERSRVPYGLEVSPCSVEDVFIGMIKGVKRTEA